MAPPTRTLRSANRDQPPTAAAAPAPTRARQAAARLQPVVKSASKSSRNLRSRSDTRSTQSASPIQADEMLALRAQFGLRDCRVVLRRLAADTIAMATATTASEELSTGRRRPLRRCTVLLERLPELGAPEEPEVDVANRRSRSRSPSRIYSPVCPILSQRADGSVSPQPQPPVPRPPSPQTVRPKPLTDKRPAYRSPPTAASSTATASASPENVYEFLSMSQDDPPAPLDPVIERLAIENRIELKGRRKNGGASAAVAAAAKKRKAPAKPKPRAPTKAELQQQMEVLRAELQRQKQELYNEKLKQRQQRMEVVDSSEGAVLEVAPVAVAAPMMLPPAARGVGKPVVLKSGLRLKPTHQSTPIRVPATMTAAAANPLSLVSSTPAPSTSNTAAAASPWRVTDEHVPSTVYFSVSGRDLLPTYSSDVLVTAPSAAEQTLLPSVARKRSAEQAQLAAGQETQKRPKLTVLGAAAAGQAGTSGGQQPQSMAADVEPQKRLNFDESNAPDSFEATPVFHAIPAMEAPVPLVEITPPFLDVTPEAPLQSPPIIAAPPPSIPERLASSAVESPLLQLSASPLNLSDAENIRPTAAQFAQQRGKGKAPATRIVLGERPTLASGARNPLAPIAIRSVILSPHSAHSSSGSSSTSSAERLASKQTPFSPTKFMAATRPIRRVLQLTGRLEGAGPAAEKTPSPPERSIVVNRSSGGDDGGGGCENDSPLPIADQSGSPKPPAQLDRSLAECFGFADDAPELEPTSAPASAAASVPAAAQLVVNPCALRAQMRKHVPAVTARRDSGPRRLVALHAPRAAANLFRDPAASMAAAVEAERRKEAIKVAMQQQREKSIPSTAAAAAEESQPAEAGTSEEAAAEAAQRASIALPRYSEFEREVQQAGKKAETDQTVDPEPLFETRWPEQNKPNRKSYSRPQRKRPVESSFTDSDESAADGDDDDANDDGGARRRRKRSKKERRKVLEAAAAAVELARFANEFNSMCDEVEQFDVVMEKSL